jgi:hypothetical protein
VQIMMLRLRALFTGLCVLAQDYLNVMSYQVSREGRKRTSTVRLIFQPKVLAYEGGWQRLVFEVANSRTISFCGEIQHCSPQSE